MSYRIFSQFRTAVFAETPCIFRTERLWRDTDGVLSRLGCKKAIYSLPHDADNVEIVKSKGQDGVFTVMGVTESGYFEPMVSLTFPVEDQAHDSESDSLLVIKMKKSLEDLSEEWDVEIVITKEEASLTSDVKGGTTSYIHLIGLESHVLGSESSLISLLELYQSSRPGVPQKFVEYLDLEAYSMLPVAIGIDMANIRHISTTYKTDVHVPSLLLPMCCNLAKKEELYQPQVHLSGEIHSLVLSAKEALLKTVERSRSSIYYRKFSNISPGKLLFIREYYQTELTRLMIKYQSFIRVTDTCVEFQSPSGTLLNSVIKVFTMNVLHQIVEIQVILQENLTFTEEMVKVILSNDEGGPLVAMKLINSENQLVLIGNHSYGLNLNSSGRMRKNSSEVMYHLSMIFRALPQDSLRQLKAIFELHMDYEEFISGKKNGKVTRIMEAVPCLIKLERLEEDDNIFLTLVADSFPEFADAFSLVIDELPAEESFFIPEVYHRPVIGAGGSVIQAIMKKYNVFVRFSNSFFLPQNDLSHVRYDNVIIRCPFKNVSTISDAKHELNQLARECGELQPRTYIKFSPGQYRHIMSSSTNRGGQLIGEIEKRFNVYIMFPFEEPPENNLLEIRGNDDNSIQAAKELIKTSFGIERELKLDRPIKLTGDIYNCIVTPFKRTMKIEVTFSGNVIRLTYEQGNPSLVKALEVLAEFLKRQKLRIVSKDVTVDFILVKNKSSFDYKSGPKGACSPIEVDQTQYQLSAAPLVISGGIRYTQSQMPIQAVNPRGFHRNTKPPYTADNPELFPDLYASGSI